MYFDLPVDNCIYMYIEYMQIQKNALFRLPNLHLYNPVVPGQSDYGFKLVLFV